MATIHIQKRAGIKRNSYIVRYKDPASGKLKHYKAFRRMKDAQKSAGKLRVLIESGKLSNIEKSKTKLKFLSFIEVAELLDMKWQDQAKVGELSEKTLREYQIFLSVLSRRYGGRILCQISSKDLLDYQKEMAEATSNVTSNRYMFILKRVFQTGTDVGALIEDPAERIKYLSEKSQQRDRFLYPEELDTLIGGCKKTKGKFYLPALVLLGAEHGASKQECLNLKWRDINFEVQGKGIVRLFRTKNNKKRTEYLLPRTRGALLNWKKHLEFMRHRKKIKANGDDHVFCRLDGRPIKRFDKSFREACRIARIDDFRFHDLRHTFASNLLLSGSSLKDVKEIIGHSDLSMTDRYSHITTEHMTSRLDRLAEHYLNGKGVKTDSAG